MAFYLAVNLEHFVPGVPSTSIVPATAGLPVDPLNHGWRDYGLRVGIWRLVETVDRLGVPVTAIVNSDVCAHYPEVIEAGIERGWCWVAHGTSRSRLHTGFSSPAEERAHLEQMLDVLCAATGARPMGWLGPALTETEATLPLLADLGLNYTLDWCHDDQPGAVAGLREFVTVPYSVELNDIRVFLDKAMPGEQYVRMCLDWLDQLKLDLPQTGRVLPLPIHPFVANQPSRHRYLEEVLSVVMADAEVWPTTADLIARAYLGADG
ncbi:polysaccharide deacetylase family protein [Streptosporangium sp. NBC_01755]|uniref:polysaccharide deacetylase family protein n=1 Tax=unclassified Streptosporangium TaxID=2632669 RepID=UPI002DDB840A|nr:MULTISPECIES: polysaccharide deacetylase family protein [unclassified Streptosporangium]WSA28235.1 polysaccharide deacetylase family protein [Streptosporangium sp. NBC_01810]WSD00288.1 polysaccharide deacetylase family protein [Streptosporangium sp. NBC_01755]